MEKDRLVNGGRSAVVEQEPPNRKAPKRRSAEHVAGSLALDDAIGKGGAHLVE